MPGELTPQERAAEFQALVRENEREMADANAQRFREDVVMKAYDRTVSQRAKAADPNA